MPEDTRAANEIAARQTPGVLQKPVEPLECHLLDPARCARFSARYEIQRCADAEHQTARASPNLKTMCNDLLLRRAYCQKAEAERALRFDEAQTVLGGVGIADEAHRWIMVTDVGQSESCANGLGVRVAAADQHYPVRGRDNPTEQFNCEIRSRRDRKTLAFQNAHRQGNDPAVQQHVRSRLVKGPEGRVLVVAKQMVDVRRYDVAIALDTKCRCDR